jgi:acyl carrier protein
MNPEGFGDGRSDNMDVRTTGVYQMSGLAIKNLSDTTSIHLERILAIISKECGIPVPQLLLDSSIESLGIASIDIVQSIFELETQFDIEISVLSAGTEVEFVTLRALVDHVLNTIERACPPSAAHQYVAV